MDDKNRRSALAFVAGEAWAMTREGLELLLAVASRDELFSAERIKALEARRGEPLKNARTTTVRDGVAAIPVMGPLFRHASMLTDVSGATSYADIRKDLQVALEDPAVRAIVLHVDSPGGEVTGVAELADAIYAARGRKPLVAYVGGTGASAAYWIASSADRIVAAETAQLGSIGVRMAVVDDRKAEEARGERTVEIISSQSPYKRTDVDDDGDRARLQRRADDLAEVFVAKVARNRGVRPQVVLERYGKGDVLVGERAVEAGLADRLGSFEVLLAELATGASRPSPMAAQGNGHAVPGGENRRAQMNEDTANVEATHFTPLADWSTLTADEALRHAQTCAQMGYRLVDRDGSELSPEEYAEKRRACDRKRAFYARLRPILFGRAPNPAPAISAAPPEENRNKALLAAIDREMAADPLISPATASARAVSKDPTLLPPPPAKPNPIHDAASEARDRATLAELDADPSISIAVASQRAAAKDPVLFGARARRG